MLTMEQEDVYITVPKEHLLIGRKEHVIIIQTTVHMDGVMTIIIVVLIYALDLIHGILMEIMKLIFVKLDAVKVHGLITILELEYVLLCVQVHTTM